MDRWTFNSVLFSRLADVLDISITEMAKRVDIGQQTLNRYINGANELPVEVMMKMCNALRMPVYYFVSENNNYEIPNREIATISADQWKPIDWDCKAVEHTFGDGEGRIYWKDVAIVMGVTPQKPHDRFLLRTRFTMKDFLAVCSHFDLDPFKFLIDPNRDSPKKKGRNSADNAANNMLLRDIASMREEISNITRTSNDLAKKFQDIAKKYDDIKTKYDGLLVEHEALLKRFNSHLDENYIGIAADFGPSK